MTRFHSTAPSDNFGDVLLKMIMARAAQGESQIEEHIERNAHTAASMPLAQAFVAGVGVLSTVVGLAAIGSQAAFLFGWRLLPGDYLLIAVIGLLIIVVSFAAVRILADQYSAAAVGVVVGGLVGLVIVALIAALLSHRDSLTWWRAGLIALGLAALIPGVALSYRQLVDLVDPFGKTSAMERMIKPYLSQLFGGTEPEPEPEYSRFVPHRLANETAALNIGTGPLHPKDAELLEFVRRAATAGLSRRVWLGQTLETSGQSVTRDRYEFMIDRLVHLGYVHPGGQGYAARWAVPPSEAVEDLENQANMVTTE